MDALVLEGQGQNTRDAGGDVAVEQSMCPE